MDPIETTGSMPLILKNKDGLYEGDLTYYYKTVFRNAENLFNGYHNLRHLCHVLWRSYSACMYYSSVLSRREMRDLLIAAFLHDLDHLGEKVPDIVNIERAVKGLKRYIASEDKAYIDDIELLIRVTEYPYTTEVVELRELIIRDADVSQALDLVWLQQVVIGFAKEWNLPPVEVLRKQKGFLSGLTFRTGWARELFPKSVIDAKIAEAEELLEIVDD